MTGYLAPEHRGEWTDAKGKLFHNVSTWPDGREEVTAHVGSWLTCDTCNPVRAIHANPAEARFTALRAEYAEADKEAKAAAERLATVKAKLKTALTDATGGALRSALHVPGYQPLLLTYSERWTVDSKALKAELPVIYVQYAKQGSAWTLTEGKADQG